MKGQKWRSHRRDWSPVNCGGLTGVFYLSKKSAREKRLRQYHAYFFGECEPSAWRGNSGISGLSGTAGVAGNGNSEKGQLLDLPAESGTKAFRTSL